MEDQQNSHIKEHTTIKPLIKLENVSIFLDDKEILKEVNFKANTGDFIYIIGKVGSGKSSLLKSLYGELPIAEGAISVLEQDLCKLKPKHLPALRQRLGIVFQDFRLLAQQTVHDNLDVVLRSTGKKKKADREQRIGEVLSLVGLIEKANNFPHELSGGEQQRISIARALLNHPKIILADEPTGNLDRQAGDRIIELLRSVSDQGTAVIMVTHNLSALQSYPGIVYRCENNRLYEVGENYNISKTSDNEK
ncbi:MAG: ATP-binding cassette domain-containing protein [Alloprevotella tannerae]|jgi:Predicted ATPase involved in cell division|nr:ATP-binding cassette domain-containing protein [Alloprevotella tannerae]